jgi:predicted nuclease of restriction endonuclease-like (RecB) superfamily
MAKKQKTPLIKAGTRSLTPTGYVELLNELKEKIRKAQLKAALAVNSELVFLYWEIGQMLSAKMADAKWGVKVIDRLANDLGNDFPGVSGFSPRNLRYMRKFAESYADPSILQALLARIPWWHNILLLEKLDNHGERMWYAEQTIINGWSGRVLNC